MRSVMNKKLRALLALLITLACVLPYSGSAKPIPRAELPAQEASALPEACDPDELATIMVKLRAKPQGSARRRRHQRCVFKHLY